MSFKLMPQSSSITIAATFISELCVPAFLHARSLFFFCESFHALLKRWSVHIFWIMESFAPNDATNSETDNGQGKK